MISLKRDSAGRLVNATGLRSRNSSIYTPNQTTSFKISRTKFNDFLTCKRCFYLDRVKGIVSPSLPGWTLNETTDLLLKREFDICREQQIPHRIFEMFQLHNVVPFKHPDIDLWRDSLHHGLFYTIKNTHIVLSGGIDDIWFNQNDKQLIVVEYKSQSNNRPVTTQSYLAGTYRESYKIQLDIYAFLLTKMGFPVSDTGYFYVCNAKRNASRFDSHIEFEETLVPYKCQINWIEAKLNEMSSLLNSYELPERNPSCENCAYAFQRSIMEKST